MRDCLYNWIGYGNLDGKCWIVGREESFSLQPCEKVDTREEYLRLRREFDTTVDFGHTWENVFGRRVEDGETKGVSTRRYQAAFVLALSGETVTRNGSPLSNKIRKFVYENKKLGDINGNNLSAELFPLDKKSNDTIEPYGHIWDTPSEYKNEVLPRRLDLFERGLKESDGVEYLVTYAKEEDFAVPMRDRFESERIGTYDSGGSGDDYVVDRLRIGNKDVRMIHSPFLGFGRVSYSGIEAVSQEVKTLSD